MSAKATVRFITSSQTLILGKTTMSANALAIIVAQGAEHFNELLADIDINTQRGQNLIQVFKTATRMEVAFWQQCLNAMQS